MMQRGGEKRKSGGGFTEVEGSKMRERYTEEWKKDGDAGTGGGRRRGERGRNSG